MLDSVYIKAKRKRDLIKQKVDEIEYPVVDASQQWVDYPIEENGLKGNIAAGDGSINKIRFLPFIFYAIDAEGIVHTHDGLKRIESTEVDIISHHKYVEDRLRSYMGMFEIKNALRMIKEYEVDLFLFDGSILGNIIRPFPIERELKERSKEIIREKYLPLLEEKLKKSTDIRINSSEFLNDIENEFEEDVEPMIYLENLESLLVISDLMEKREKIVSISKTSTSTEYFNTKIPDMAIFDMHSKNQGYSRPRYSSVSEVKHDFPVRNSFLKSLTFTIFYARLEDYKNILKFELPYRATEEDIKVLLKTIKTISAEGYPLLLKKAHNDVVIRKNDLNNISNIMGFLDKKGREMLMGGKY
ncbi:MAG: double-strand break repair nuclease NurA [Methanobacterium sp.]|jgi:NurA-like 5'-3' nuclease|uniref:DNA double-strand break repair nuclease NurA n=1 Tax=Methanobacterium sp. TaxID=2164 RepID=UPI0003C951C8|nr:DNA double-strand break repair nuclease NurA [Methanobacterium sp.]MDI3550209.1 double-strand break repair nuclease NurA [Methanobacterium sp.]CDG64410.1 NurA domain-containing protein [Methanobacterium sp. MB1]